MNINNRRLNPSKIMAYFLKPIKIEGNSKYLGGESYY
jgi:hypothetical protein